MDLDLLKTLRDGFKADAQKYKAENTRLRELCAELYKCATRGANCVKCAEYNDGHACAYVMQDLGIEVGDLHDEGA